MSGDYYADICQIPGQFGGIFPSVEAYRNEIWLVVELCWQPRDEDMSERTYVPKGCREGVRLCDEWAVFLG